MYAVFCTAQGRPTVTFAHLHSDTFGSAHDGGEADASERGRDVHAHVVQADGAVDVESEAGLVHELLEVGRALAFIFTFPRLSDRTPQGSALCTKRRRHSPSRLN